MSLALDLSGRRFGRLVANKRVGSDAQGKAKWHCACDCGATCLVTGTHLSSGNTLSCGCVKRQVASLSGRGRRSHGHAVPRSPTYRTWRSMLDRCEQPHTNGFQRYGGAGVRVCERWHVFENFLADVGERPAGMTLDRIDNGKGYEPGNCRWATPKQQRANQQKGGV